MPAPRNRAWMRGWMAARLRKVRHGIDFMFANLDRTTAQHGVVSGTNEEVRGRVQKSDDLLAARWVRLADLSILLGLLMMVAQAKHLPM